MEKLGEEDVRSAVGLLGDGERCPKTEFVRRVRSRLGCTRSKARRVMMLAVERNLLTARRSPETENWTRPAIFIQRTSAAPAGKTIRSAAHGTSAVIGLPKPLGGAPDGEDFAEVWVSVPGTGCGYEVSNRSHMRMISGRTMPVDGRTPPIVCTPVPLEVMFATGEFGWHMSVGGEWRFYPRREVAGLFKGMPTFTDRAEEDCARAHHEILKRWSEQSKKEVVAV